MPSMVSPIALNILNTHIPSIQHSHAYDMVFDVVAQSSPVRVYVRHYAVLVPTKHYE
jgi:hypothetical protein